MLNPNKGIKDDTATTLLNTIEDATKLLEEVMTSIIFIWWCFNPGVALEEFAKNRVGSIILTSGTLSPMDSFAEELRLNFAICLENPHVISDDQLWAGIVRVGPTGHALNSPYKTRGYVEYQRNLGNSIGKNDVCNELNH
nr:regulator of telomere elongation helicase 1 isoform X1 [Tanacetum cinerariifolium]